MWSAQLEFVLVASQLGSIACMQSALPAEVLTPAGDVRYFAFGSNLGAAKLRGRAPNATGGATAITWRSRAPAAVRDHRLAFNMRMFPPLEPAMASIEPAAGATCEGCVVVLDRASYDALWRSEGGAMARPPYEQLVVRAEALGGGGEAVAAITLRAAPWARLRRDAPPSARYLDLIVAGARELGPPSARALAARAAARPSRALRALAAAHGVVAIALFRLGLGRALAPLRAGCYAVLYAGPSRARRALSELATMALLAPTALVGALVRAARRALGMAPLSFAPGGASPPANAAEAKAKANSPSEPAI